MIEKNPQLLLQTGIVICAHTGETLRGTPLRIAWRVKDTEMVALFQSHMDLKDIETQQNEQFPEGYENYKKAEAEKIKEGYRILQETFEAIHDAKFKKVKNKFFMDKKTKLALTHLKNYLKPRGIIETGEDITDVLLLQTIKLYEANFLSFRIPAQRLISNSPKNILAWRLLGMVELGLKFSDIQAMSEGSCNTCEKKKTGKPQGRTLTFNLWNKGEFYMRSHFLSMVSDSARGLGACYAIGDGGRAGVTPHDMGPGPLQIGDRICSGFGWFQALCQLKNMKLAELIRSPARVHHQQPPKTETICRVM